MAQNIPIRLPNHLRWNHTKWVITFDPAGGKFGRLDSSFYFEVIFNATAESIKPDDKRMKKKDATFKHWAKKGVLDTSITAKTKVTENLELIAVWE